MTLSPTALEEAAKAVEQDLSRDMAAWVERYTGPHGCDDDAPEPPKGNYRSTPTRLATAAITAYLAQAEKEGWVMVPKVASEAMLKAGARKARLNDSKMQDAPGYEGECHDIYAAMIAAAQNGGE